MLFLLFISISKPSIMTTDQLIQSPLGQDTAYPNQYDPSVLFAIERTPNRSTLALPNEWYGADIWYAYEISWLNAKGKPMTAVGRFTVPWDSTYLIESKSFKLYLNSFNNSRFESIKTVKKSMEQDLSAAANANVEVSLYELEPYSGPIMGHLEGEVIDHLDIDVTHYSPNADLLTCNENGMKTSETLVSHLLKSNCPVTGQPDWATLQIKYTGVQIEQEALLRYIISFRQHTEFHEHCVEKIYTDIMTRCQPTQLFVMARYTRRGGLDINPWRSSHAVEVADIRTVRQ